MASFNLVILVGNLTRDVELKYTQNQLAIAKFGLAVNDRVKKNNEWVDEATFVDITLFGRTAEIANQYLSKGSSVLIEGRLKLDSWETDGQKRSKLHVIGERMQMLGARGGAPGGGAPGGGSGGRASAGAQSSEYDHADSMANANRQSNETGDVPF